MIDKLHKKYPLPMQTNSIIGTSRGSRNSYCQYRAPRPRMTCVAPPLAHPLRSKICASIRSLQCRGNTYLSSRRIHGVQEVSLQVHAILSLLELLHFIPRGVLAVRCRGGHGTKYVPDNISYCLSGRHFFSFARTPAFLSFKLIRCGLLSTDTTA